LYPQKVLNQQIYHIPLKAMPIDYDVPEFHHNTSADQRREKPLLQDSFDSSVSNSKDNKLNVGSLLQEEQIRFIHPTVRTTGQQLLSSKDPNSACKINTPAAEYNENSEHEPLFIGTRGRHWQLRLASASASEWEYLQETGQVGSQTNKSEKISIKGKKGVQAWLPSRSVSLKVGWEKVQRMSTPSTKWKAMSMKQLSSFKHKRYSLEFGTDALLSNEKAFHIANCSKLLQQVDHVVQKFFGKYDNAQLPGSNDSFWFRQLSSKFANYAQCLARPGVTSMETWDSLLRYDDERCRLIGAVIFKTLDDHVFQRLLFGANREQQILLDTEEKTLVWNEGRLI
jgi:hypothetical protein